MGDKYNERRMSKEVCLLIDRDVREIIESFDVSGITQHKVLLEYVGKITEHSVDIETLDPYPWSTALLKVVNSDSYVGEFGPETFTANTLNVSFVAQCMTGDLWFCVDKYYRDRVKGKISSVWLGE